MDKNYAKVYILDAPYCIDRTYDYFLPPDLRNHVNVGNFVTVPFGNGNKRYMALVSEISDKADYPDAKPIISVCPPDVSLDSEMLKLCKFMKGTTLCTYGDAVHTMLPSAAMSRFEEYFRVTEKELSPLTGGNSKDVFQQLAAPRARKTCKTHDLTAPQCDRNILHPCIA